MASAADRRRAQRRLAKEIKTRTFRPSPIGRRAREIAREVREREPPGGGQRDTRQLREDVKARKQRQFGDYFKFRRRASERLVDSSDEFGAMEEALDMSDDQLENMASRYAIAMKSGAEDWEDEFNHIDWSFLFYH